MTIATTLYNYLAENAVTYDILAHEHTLTSGQTAQASHVSGDRIAKSVLLEDEMGYLLAVLPASRRVDLGELHRQLNRNLGLATEQEIDGLFRDCEPGALPPIGTAYGMETIVDDILVEQPEIYFEAGDHEQLIHVSTETFEYLLGEVRHARFSRYS